LQFYLDAGSSNTIMNSANSYRLQLIINVYLARLERFHPSGLPRSSSDGEDNDEEDDKISGESGLSSS